MYRKPDIATFGASCFWGSEASFRSVPGVTDTAVGFMADSLCSGETPSSDDEAKTLCCVEVVRVEFDTRVVGYGQLLEIFWSCHDATRHPYRTDDNQPSLERSVIFTHNARQQDIAEQSRSETNSSGRYDTSVTTVIEPTTHFHRAHEGQQRYLERNTDAVCSTQLSVRSAKAAE